MADKKKAEEPIIEIKSPNKPATEDGKVKKRQKPGKKKGRAKKVVGYIPGPRRWWERRPCLVAFSHPKVRSRLERLMGSNLVRLTDRKYMLQLHDRILEDYIQSMNKRIENREAMERDREKTLVLTGKVPLSQAPKEMANHPVLLIDAYCQKLIAERRAKIKVPKVYIPLFLFLDDTPDPAPGLSIVNGHVFRKMDNRMCVPPEVHLAFSDDDDIERGYMFDPDEFEELQRFQSDEIRELEEVETVEEMYMLADAIIGPLKTIQQRVFAEEPKAKQEAAAE